MAKDDKIHIKLEICRDEASNKLMIMTHFDTSAPNFFKDDDGYFWMPTMEEKNLLNEVFEFMPASSITPSSVKSTLEPPEKQAIFPPAKTEVKPEEPPLDKKEEVQPTDLPTLEKTSESDAFEATEEEPKTESPTTEKKEEEKGILVEADDGAIEAAIKKHGLADDDKSIVEADEQTIIEKVLSQKKKGKWGSKGRH